VRNSEAAWEKEIKNVSTRQPNRLLLKRQKKKIKKKKKKKSRREKRKRTYIYDWLFDVCVVK
jgi:hypothetical protein